LEVHLLLSKNVERKFTVGDFTVHCILPPYPHAKRGIARTISQAIYYAAVVRTTTAFLNELKPAVVHAQDFKWVTGPIELGFMRAPGRRVCYTAHNVMMHSLPKIGKSLALAATRRAYKECDLIFVHGDTLKTQLRSFLKSDRPEIAVTPHGVLLPEGGVIEPITTDRLKRKKLLFFGHVRPNKGLELALDSLSLLEGYELTIAGECRASDYWKINIEPRLEKLKAQGKAVSIDQRYYPEEEVAGLFNRHSCAVLPYTPDFHAQSGILLLALGANLPVVATDVGELGASLGEMGIGEVVDSRDPAAFAAAIEKVHAQNAQELAAKFRTAQEKWSWSNCAKATAEAYRRQMCK
jgi:glycosyltransferase involved in cell wall biosynthesis